MCLAVDEYIKGKMRVDHMKYMVKLTCNWLARYAQKQVYTYHMGWGKSDLDLGWIYHYIQKVYPHFRKANKVKIIARPISNEIKSQLQ